MSLRPLITICGTTGVGKSKLAIELAIQLLRGSPNHGWKGARIINADSMQVYSGMDVVTNKVPEAEMQGIEHLLIGFKKPGEQYFVGQWVQDAIQAIDETHSKGQIPIVVGGTSYWIQHLMFPDRLASSETTSRSPSLHRTPLISDTLADSLLSLTPQLLSLYNNLPDHAESASKDPQGALQLHALLSALDPAVASRWHWKDTRKVLRSIRIMQDTGCKPSDIISQQSQVGVQPRYRTLCLWLYAEPSVLHSRLYTRVNDMIEQGLLNEIIALREIESSHATLTTQNNKCSTQAENSTADYTTGIYQSIGYREFHEYLSSPHRTEKAFNDAVENMKQSTRRYAKRQVSWLRNKLLPMVYATNAEGQKTGLNTPTYLLDATELGKKWNTNVRDLGQQITEDFLAQRDLPDPKTLSDSARKMLSVNDKPTNPKDVLNARRRVICAACTIDSERPVTLDEGQEWELHQNSRTHKKFVARSKRLLQQTAPSKLADKPGTYEDAQQDFDGSVASILS